MENQNYNPENENEFDDLPDGMNNDPDYEEEYLSEEVEADNYFYGIEEGYELAKRDPEKVNKLVAEMSPYCNTYQAGIKAGKERYDREIAETRRSQLSQLRGREKGKELTRSR